MNITAENIKDLEVVLGLAISSEYLDDSNDKACDRVEKLIETLKKVKNNDLLHSVSQRYTIEDIERCVENWGLCKVEKKYIEKFLNGG